MVKRILKRYASLLMIAALVLAAKLKNVNGTFTETASASAGDSI